MNEMNSDGDRTAAEPDPTGVRHSAMRRFVDGLSIPAWLTNSAGEIAYVNAEWALFTGHAPREVTERVFLSDVLADDRASLLHALNTAVRNKAAMRFDFQLRRSDGQYRWISAFGGFYGDPDGSGGMACMCIDLTERRQREEQLAYMATHDSLTGLPNRRMFEHTLERAVSRAKRGTVSALLVLDIDNFKSYNDALGHLEGDQALANFALLLQRHVRAGDLLARIGGDEFAVLFEGTAVEEAVDIAERMRVAASHEEFVAHARVHELSLSAGLVPVDGTRDGRAVFDLADAAMYRAKEQGRDQVVVGAANGDAANHPERLASKVRVALAEERFVLHFQPVVHLADQSVAYYESLVRMVEPDGTLVMPGGFLTAVERLGLMPRLSRLVIAQALSALGTHRTATVSINLSAGDLADDSLPAFVDELLSAGSLDPARLVIEMPETAVVADMASAGSWIERLSRKGVRFVLDDFGAGLGLFGLLKELPFDEVKLDGSIIAALSANGDNSAFVEAVRHLIEAQGRVAVASWVESAELLDRVRGAGFELGQGYHIEVPSGDLGALIERYG